MSALIIILLIFAVLLVIFTLQNSVMVSIKVLFWEISDAPLVLVLIGCIIIGYILATIYLYPKLWKLKREYNQLIKFNSELKNLHEMNHPDDKKVRYSDPDINDEGIELDDKDEHSFFAD